MDISLTVQMYPMKKAFFGLLGYTKKGFDEPVFITDENFYRRFSFLLSADL